MCTPRRSNASSQMWKKGIEGCTYAFADSASSINKISRRGRGPEPKNWRAFRMGWYGLSGFTTVKLTLFFLRLSWSLLWSPWSLFFFFFLLSFRLYANDGINPYVCVYEPPAPSHIQNVTHLRWRGLLCPNFIREVLDTIMCVKKKKKNLSSPPSDHPLSSWFINIHDLVLQWKTCIRLLSALLATLFPLHLCHIYPIGWERIMDHCRCLEMYLLDFLGQMVKTLGVWF